MSGRAALRAAAAVLCLAASATAGAATVLVEEGSALRWRRNASDPGIGLAWVQEGFDDSGWPQGVYGIGYETAPPGATGLIATAVASPAASVYTRARFTLADPSAVQALLLSADYDDGFAAWINGVEVYRSPQMPAGTPAWNTVAASHESSNGSSPSYGAAVDVTAAALPALHAGENVLAVGVWNAGATSSDLVLVPKLELGTPLRRGPYLQLGTPTGVVVRWRTSTAMDSRVLYGPSPGELSGSVTVPGARTEHVVALAGLTPGARYHYAIGSSAQVLAGGDGLHTFVTAPAAGTRRATRVWVLGDSGTADAGQRAVRDAYEGFAQGAVPDLWLMLGDNAYDDGTDDEYQAAVFDMYPGTLRASVLWPTLGNHDGRSASSASQSGVYYDVFTLPAQGEAGGMPSGTEAYYSFDHANIHFICLESFETDRSAAGAMMSWLEEDLASTSQDWIIAFWHHPPYSKGSHDSDTEIELIEMRAHALPILEAGGVDLVLAGHSHSYERSFLLDGHYGGSGTLTAAMIADGGDGRPGGDGAYSKPQLGPQPNQGAVYVVAGSSGQISGGPLNHPAMFVSLNELGSLALDVAGPALEARFVDGDGMVLDSFALCKGSDPMIEDAGDTLRLGPSPDAVSWTRPPGASSSDLYRGTLSGPFLYTHACLASGLAGESAIDGTIPPAGSALYYLAGGRSACGRGPLGTDSTGALLPAGSPCP
ncbi:MAG TPA: metallophosphoesterase family protein [Candidatus Polarisedimenticolia bacterium]|nr:metallophosphoesterase family protein [Candidatus Polarisedimenticolia bacterium]